MSVNSIKEISIQLKKLGLIVESIWEIQDALVEVSKTCQEEQKNTDEAYQKGYDAGIIASSYVDKSDEAYQRGLDDAWEAARKIVLSPDEGGLSVHNLFKIFGRDTSRYALKNYSASEAIEKLKAYDEIKVGDEVESLYNDGTVIENMIPWVVTKIREVDGKKHYYGIDAEGTSRNNDFVRKTGRYFGIDKILEEMKNKLWGVEF